MTIIVDDTMFGDSPGVLDAWAVAGSQSIDLPAGSGIYFLFGDALVLADHARGGDDHLTSMDSTRLYGDAETITDFAQGGNDSVIVGSQGFEAYGDAVIMSGHGRGGDDYVEIAGAFSYYSGFAFGDAKIMTDHARGGNDQVFGRGGPGTAVLYGDSDRMEGHAHGGDDTLSAAPGVLVAYRGDAQNMAEYSVGGDDLLIAPVNEGGGVAELVGDAYEMLDSSQGGHDRLVSAARSSEDMWGDAVYRWNDAVGGQDTFVFSVANGHDRILDFEPEKDRIELDGFGFSGFEDLAAHFQTTAGGVLISFSASDDILVRGVSVNSLTAEDFLFG